jgi:hypothetical protein
MQQPSPIRHDSGEVRIREAAGAAVVVLAACWAAGLVGLMAEPLRVVGTWLLLGLALGLAGSSPIAWPPGSLWRWAAVLLMLAVPLTGWTDARHEVLLVAVVAACLADARRGAARAMFGSVALAILAWSLLASVSRCLPWAWHISEFGAEQWGAVASLMSGTRLRIGASFGGFGLLGLLGVLYAVWLLTAMGPRRYRAVMALAFIVAVHLGYLLLLAHSLDLAERLPEVPEREYQHPYTPPPWSWSAAVGTLLPWSLPLLAAVLHASVVGLLYRWSRWPTDWPPSGWAAACSRRWAARLRLPDTMLVLVFLAVVVPVASDLSLGRTDLTGKVILANRQGRLDWRRPVHDRYGRRSAGMFGILPKLVQSLGGELRVVQSWDETELSAADAVVLLHPTSDLSAQQRTRILDYVRDGGALLVVAEAPLRQDDAISGHNEVLHSTSISVRRDVGVPKTAGWQHALWLSPHPATAGVNVRRSHFFTGMGASLEIRSPARPVIAGRWGWSDPGSDSLFTGVQRWEPGERLGDLVLAAEQRHGRGRILVIGDGYSLTNEGGFRGYWLSGPLLSYLTHGSGNPASVGGQILTLLLAGGLVVLLLVWPEPRRLAVAAVVLALGLAACAPITRHATRMVPDGRLLADGQDRLTSRLAYVGASHAEMTSDAPWSPDGIEGLALTLMRHDLLTLSLPRLTREHLQAAGIYVSVAPSRSFSARERRMLVEFVERGGIFIATVGAEESEGSRELLADFGIRVPASPVPTVSAPFEPEPMGRTRRPYLRVESEDGETYDLSVNFFAGWPVELLENDGQVLVYGRPEHPVAVLRSVGQGKVVVIGDSGFALNKNLEVFGGEPFPGGYENAHFWRWLLVHLIDEQLWLPPLEAEPSTAVVPGQEAR